MNSPSPLNPATLIARLEITIAKCNQTFKTFYQIVLWVTARKFTVTFINLEIAFHRQSRAEITSKVTDFNKCLEPPISLLVSTLNWRMQFRVILQLIPHQNQPQRGNLSSNKETANLIQESTQQRKNKNFFLNLPLKYRRNSNNWFLWFQIKSLCLTERWEIFAMTKILKKWLNF